MEREILAYIKQNRMIGKNDVVLAGVSGGSDSMAMLRILKELQEKLDFTLRVVHIHHGIRGKEADRDQSFVENICRKWQIPCTVYCYDVPGSLIFAIDFKILPFVVILRLRPIPSISKIQHIIFANNKHERSF